MYSLYTTSNPDISSVKFSMHGPGQFIGWLIIAVQYGSPSSMVFFILHWFYLSRQIALTG